MKNKSAEQNNVIVDLSGEKPSIPQVLKVSSGKAIESIREMGLTIITQKGKTKAYSSTALEDHVTSTTGFLGGDPLRTKHAVMQELVKSARDKGAIELIDLPTIVTFSPERSRR